MRVGIITHFHGSTNCGGRLQALALCKVLNQMNCSAEQLCYQIEGCILKKPSLRNRLAQIHLYQWLRRVYRLFKLIPEKPVPVTNDNPQKSRHVRELFEAWSNRYIPHSTSVYSNATIGNCAKDYDVLITGSDQVWNLNWYCPAFFLAFAPSSIHKISYAASVCNDEYTKYQQKVVARHLADFKAVSVREEESVRVIEKLSPVSVEVTLDPTLLLERSDWDEFADERLVAEPYLFCYYLGNDPTERRLAQEYAAAHHLKVVVINQIDGWDVPEDRAFSDIALDDITPGGFVSLIKHAECVFTDSFHGCVFSSIYRKNVFVFGRSGQASMSSRIHSVSGLFGFEDRFCNTPKKTTLNYIENCAAIDYEGHWQQYETEKQKSIEFLRRNVFAGKDTK